MFQESIESICIVDFGGQYAHLIARRVRQLGVFSRIVDPDAFHPDREEGLVGVILSGGPRSVTEEELLALPFSVAELKVPVLGLCYGHQLIAKSLGGVVQAGEQREYGLTHVTAMPDSFLGAGLPARQEVWMSHGDHVTTLPAGFKTTFSSPSVPIAGYQSLDGRVFGLQFHPEVTHTRHGMEMLERFVLRCAPGTTWNPGSIVDRLIESVREQAGDRHLFLLASGGVDSLVALVLCIRALGNDRVTSLHVDTGFMRLHESREVMAALQEMGFGNLHVVDASQRFFGALKGIIEPEEKRRIIGRLFVEEVDLAIADLLLPENWLLVQGTIYPDTIESGGTRHASTIKTHHNRVPEIERMIQAGRIIEPLRDLYKDEVRDVGMQLGLPEALVHRHPFPGPGLAIRILCSDGTDDLDVTHPDHGALAAILGPLGLEGRILPIRSVGVQGDFRTYHHPAVVWSPEGLPTWETLLKAASDVVNRLESVNRVVFSVDPVGTEGAILVPTTLTREVVSALQQVDSLVRQRTSSYSDIWQIPVVSLPLSDTQGRRVYLVRPVCSRDAMTASPYPMDLEAFRQLVRDVSALPGTPSVPGPLWYDLTDKPPATIEWE